MAPEHGSSTVPLDTLLEVSSRTFALSIPLLPEPVRRQTTVAYLLFRIADTFEDEPAWSTEEKLAGLEAVRDLLAASADHAPTTGPAMEAVRAMLSGAELSQSGYQELLEQTEPVLGEFAALEAEVRAMIAGHLGRTIEGMAGYLRRDRPAATIDEVRLYCYHVAGIVGELLTDLFVRHNPSLRGVAGELTELSPRFGEALQLVNILRDANADAADGRAYIPGPEERAELFVLADEDILMARRYVEMLERHGADPGIVAFNTLNLALAGRTIDLVRRLGPGAKLSRPEVQDLFSRVAHAAESGRPLTPILSETTEDSATPADPAANGQTAARTNGEARGER